MPKSVMVHSFSQVPRADIPRSSFDRSHGHKTTIDADGLYPVLVDDIIPGDTFNVNMSFFGRLATPLHPIMDNIFFESFFFFVPYRLVWDNWEKFCGAQDNPADTIDYTIPTYNWAGTPAINSPWVYMGCPELLNALNGFSALPTRALNLIWNEWFRDQNLQNSVTVDTGNGPDSPANYSTILKRGKRHDYFTSCLPWPQKGTAVDLPLGTVAPVEGLTADTGPTFARLGSGGVDSYGLMNQTGVADFVWQTDDTNGAAAWLATGLQADLSGATAATINDLRLAFQTQRLLERDARSGTRYVETVLAHYGVTVPDFRVQRPEFLGGGSSQVNISPVANTSATATENQGDLAAYGTVQGTHGFTKSFVEHGVLLALVNVRSDITYSQGIERYFSKSTRYDFYYPVLAQIGEQAVLNKEIWYANNPGTGATQDDGVFGYQERYAEYRYKPSRLSGLFKPDTASSIETWHLSEDFAALPTLGSAFIESNTSVPLDRAIAVPSEPHFILDLYFRMKCARPMPVYGVPGNIDRF